MGCANAKHCANAKPTLEDAIDELKDNPTTGLLNLQTALAQVGQDTTQQDSVNARVSRIFELLPKAMETLSENNSKQVLAACAVIEQCVKAHNEVATGGQISTEATINVEHLKQCQRNLVELLKKAEEKAAQTFAEDGMECDTSSKEAKAIALATVALFKLENYAPECKQELKKSGGIAIALKAMETETSGIKRDAMQSLAWMLSMFVDDSPDNVQSIIANGGTFLLVRYVEDASKYDVPKDMQAHCRALLEACLQHGKDVKNAADIQKALASSSKRVSVRS
jgi:hypothetical protein